LRVDLGFGVIGLLGKPLHEKGGDAAVLDVAEDVAGRPGRPELLGDVGEGVRHRPLDDFDAPWSA
jgi:hypothetical protein